MVDGPTVLSWNPPKKDIIEMRRGKDFRGLTALVLGAGPSMFDVYDQNVDDVDLVIGVNRVGLDVMLDFLILLDNPKTFGPDYREVIGNQSAHTETVISGGQLRNWSDVFPDAWSGYDECLKLDQRILPWDSSPFGWLPMFNGAPFAATAFASYIGCSKVVLGGVDYTGDHGWSRAHKFVEVDRMFGLLRDRCSEEDTELWNGSRVSRLTTIPRL